MSMQSHLAELERKHQALETEIADAMAHPSVRRHHHHVELKRRKLHLKDEIARLRHDTHERALKDGDPRHRGSAADQSRKCRTYEISRTAGSRQEAGGFALSGSRSEAHSISSYCTRYVSSVATQAATEDNAHDKAVWLLAAAFVLCAAGAHRAGLSHAPDHARSSRTRPAAATT